MRTFKIIADSHLKRISRSQLGYPVSIEARGGLNVSQLTTDVFKKDQDVFFLIVGGNDIHFHPVHNTNPKTVKATAEKLMLSNF